MRPQRSILGAHGIRRLYQARRRGKQPTDSVVSQSGIRCDKQNANEYDGRTPGSCNSTIGWYGISQRAHRRIVRVSAVIGSSATRARCRQNSPVRNLFRSTSAGTTPSIHIATACSRVNGLMQSTNDPQSPSWEGPPWLHFDHTFASTHEYASDGARML